MAEPKESSVLFSLQQLMSLEQDRVAKEHADRDRRVRDVEERRQAEQRAVARAATEKVREAEEQRLQSAQRAREEAARLEAIQLAEVTRIKAETEAEAALRELTARQGHEAKLAVIHQQSSSRRTKVTAAVAIAVLSLGMAGLGLKWHADRQETEAARRETQATLARMVSDNAKLQAQIDGAEAERQRIEEALVHTRDAQEAAALKAKQAQIARRLGSLREKQNEPKLGKGGAGRSAKTPNCTCTEGDPMCDCLR
jgi:colicin import membrane protein